MWPCFQVTVFPVSWLVKKKFGISSQTFPVFAITSFYIHFFNGVEVGPVDDAGFIFILLRLVLFALWYVFVVNHLKGFCILVGFFGGPKGRAKLMQHLKACY